MFYKNNLKIIPRNLGDYLTPLALAIWFLNGCSKLGKGSEVASMFRVSKEDLKYLCKIIKNKYNIDTTIISGGKNRHTLYIKSTSMTTFYKIVKPHISPSLYYKLKGRENKLSLCGVSDSLTFSSICFTSSPSHRNSIFKGAKLNVGSRNFSNQTKKEDSNIKYTTKYKTEYKLSLIQK